MPYLAGHYYLGHAALLEKRDHTPKLSDPDPKHLADRHFVDPFVSFLPYCHDRERCPSLSGTLDDKKRELAVTGDQAVFHQVSRYFMVWAFLALPVVQMLPAILDSE